MGRVPSVADGGRRWPTPTSLSVRACLAQVARYHSLHSKQDKQPGCLRTTAVSADGVVMAIQHTSLPIAAVQFHPESILTAEHVGMQMILNATKMKAA